jgi:hypothetical protein
MPELVSDAAIFPCFVTHCFYLVFCTSDFGLESCGKTIKLCRFHRRFLHVLHARRRGATRILRLQAVVLCYVFAKMRETAYGRHTPPMEKGRPFEAGQGVSNWGTLGPALVFSRRLELGR